MKGNDNGRVQLTNSKKVMIVKQHQLQPKMNQDEFAQWARDNFGKAASRSTISKVLQDAAVVVAVAVDSQLNQQVVNGEELKALTNLIQLLHQKVERQEEEIGKFRKLVKEMKTFLMFKVQTPYKRLLATEAASQQKKKQLAFDINKET